MKKAALVLLLVVLLNRSYSFSATLPPWPSITQPFMSDTGNIRAYAKRDAAVLLESVGQQLEILLELRDERTFQRTVAILQRDFVVRSGTDTFLKWKKGDGVTVNALIDDLRVAVMLQRASVRFQQPNYKRLSDEITETITRYQLVNGALVEYYDWALRQRADTVQLSYLQPDWLKQLRVPATTWALLAATKSSPFFTESYNVATRTWLPLQQREVNLVDQLLIAENRLRLGLDNERFNQWLTKQRVLYGRFARMKPTQRTVAYTSLAVHSLAWRYAKLQHNATLMQRYAATLRLPRTAWHSVHFFDVAYGYMSLLESGAISP